MHVFAYVCVCVYVCACMFACVCVGQQPISPLSVCVSPQHGVASVIRTIHQAMPLINHQTDTHAHTHTHTLGIRAGSDEQ